MGRYQGELPLKGRKRLVCPAANSVVPSTCSRSRDRDRHRRRSSRSRSRDRQRRHRSRSWDRRHSSESRSRDRRREDRVRYRSPPLATGYRLLLIRWPLCWSPGKPCALWFLPAGTRSPVWWAQTLLLQGWCGQFPCEMRCWQTKHWTSASEIG